MMKSNQGPFIWGLGDWLQKTMRGLSRGEGRGEEAFHTALGDSYPGIYICRCSSNCTLRMCAFYHTVHSPQKNWFKKPSTLWWSSILVKVKIKFPPGHPESHALTPPSSPATSPWVARPCSSLDIPEALCSSASFCSEALPSTWTAHPNDHFTY